METLRIRFIPSNLRDDPETHHRLTLFVANKKQTRLDIFARSAEATRGSQTNFRIHADDESQCEGIAGAAWYLNTIVIVPGDNDPELPDLVNNNNETNIKQYAEKTNVSSDRVRKHIWPARSYAAMTIRVKGKKWGILVLDSRDSRGAKKRILTQMQYVPEIISHIIQMWSDQ